MTKTVGIIGFGRFGQLTAKHLHPHFEVFVNSRTNREAEAKQLGVNFTTFDECAGQDIVIISVPISDFKTVLERVVPNLKDGALVMDVCSVKEEPVEIMEQLVPKNCDCMGTHPIFGPDSASSGLNERITS